MIVIIGAGISGLYMGYMLKKLNKEFIIIEKSDRYGGRVHMDYFLNKQVPLGAGVGRFNKDKLLYELCKELDVDVNKYISKISYSPLIGEKDINIIEYISKLKKIYKENKEENKLRSRYTFLYFLKKYCKDYCKDYSKFIKKCGFSDFIHSDIEDTLDDYGFDDLIGGWEGFSIKWQALLDNLYNILKNNIILDEEVNRINTNKKYIITYKGKYKNKYKYDKLVCSATVDVSRNIFKNNKVVLNILDDLDVQTFSRIYVKIDKGNELLKEEIKNYTVLDSFLQKIIPMDSDSGIYMLGYNDNYCADKGFKVIKCHFATINW